MIARLTAMVAAGGAPFDDEDDISVNEEILFSVFDSIGLMRVKSYDGLGFLVLFNNETKSRLRFKGSTRNTVHVWW